MKVITFPLKLTDDFHKELKEAAYVERISIHEYILISIRERIEREKINND